jgi:hypothetical protein
MFFDDTACAASDTNLNNFISLVNTELTKLARLFPSNKMAVNVNKTKFIIFHTKGKPINDNECKIFYNDNEPDKNDPLLITEIEPCHNKPPTNNCRTYKLLVVYFDENMSFDHHITSLCNKLSRSLYCINKAKNFLTSKSLITLYYTLVHSHLTYCPIIVSCASASHINRILKVQKKAIRIVTKNSYTEHTQPIFHSLKILPYDKLIHFAKLKFMHSVVYCYCPSSFNQVWQISNNIREHDHELRNKNMYHLPNRRIERFKKSPLYQLPLCWDALDKTKYHQNKTTFTIALKDKLIEDLNPNPNYPQTI